MKNKLLQTTFLLLVLIFVMTLTAGAQGIPNLEITAPAVDEGPVIDGELDEKAWVTASAGGGKFVQDLSGDGTALTEFPRVGYVCYNDEALYVGYVSYAPDIEALETSGEFPYENDEVEVFVKAPDKKYIQVNVDAAEQGGIHEDKIDDFEYAVSFGDIKWQVEIGIPFAELGVTPQSGDTWKVGFTGRQVGAGDMWLTWNRTFGSFHETERFGVLHFE